MEPVKEESNTDKKEYNYTEAKSLYTYEEAKN